MSPRLRRVLAEQGLVAVLATAAAFVSLRLWRADLRVPFDYGGDGLVYGLLIKTIAKHGWYLVNPDTGAPGVLTFYDFPQFDSLHFLVLKLMSAFSKDWALLLNGYYLLGFPLIACATLATFRAVGVPLPPALLGSVLYACFPTRVLKGEGHLTLDNFFQVPLAVLVVIWVASDEPPLARQTGGDPWLSRLRDPRSLCAVAIMVLVALGGLYYAVFTAALLVIAGVLGAVERRAASNAIAGLTLAGVLCAGLALQGLPSALYRARHGVNGEVAVRALSDADLFGMRISELLLPVSGHRVHWLRDLKERYEHALPILTESATTSLGLVAGCGFLLLLVVLFRARAEGQRAGLLRVLARLNIAAVLIATVGGFGGMFALLVTPQIRAYLRMNVIIGVLSLIAFALLLERVTAGRPRLRIALTGALLLVGLLDQVTPPAIRNYSAVAAAYHADAAFVRQIEASVPPGAMMFVLPYRDFPESPRGYDGLRFYLHSRSTRWSYPAMRGRSPDLWLSSVANLAAPEMAATLSAAGFEGIVVDRDGYPAHGAEIEAALTQEIGPPALVDAGRECAYFSLAAYRRRNPNAASHVDIELPFGPVTTLWSTGFSGLERLPGMTWRWCSGSCELSLENASTSPRTVWLKTTVMVANSPAVVVIDGGLLNERIDVPAEGAPLSRKFSLPPGRHIIHFSSNGRPAVAPNDPRTMILRTVNSSIEVLPEGSNLGR